MKRSTRQLIGILAASVIGAVGLAFLVSAWPRHMPSPFVEGQPLLGQAADWFTDSQVGLQFKPPSGWSMQARTNATPLQHISPRMIVKFKRLIPNASVAWMRVNVLDAPEGATPAIYLRDRKAPEAGWKVLKDMEEVFQIGNQPAARITFGGPFDPDGRGKREFSAEVVVIRHQSQFIELIGTFPSAEADTRAQIRAVIDSVKLTR